MVLHGSLILATTKPIVPDEDKVPPVIEEDKKEDHEAKEEKSPAVDKVSCFQYF